MEDHNLRTDDQLCATLGILFDTQDPMFQFEARSNLSDSESIDPGYMVWLRGEVLKILRDNSVSIEDRLIAFIDNGFNEGPQTAWDFWAYIWETVTNGEPWPADLPPANADTFSFLRETPPLPQE